jgi:zinc D-Ala-D-Ala carboxypeptidase
MALVVVLVLVAIILALRPGASSGGSAPQASAPPTASATPSTTQKPTPSPTPSPTSTPSPTPRPTPSPPPVPTPLPTPAPSQPAGPPPCAHLDVPTAHAGYGDWHISLLDTIYHLPATYAPGDLVDSATAGLNDGHAVREIIVADLRAMTADARAAGAPIALVSGFRSHAQQEKTFAYWVSIGGYAEALRTSARPGHSEHQLGTAIDVTSEGGSPPWEYTDWGATAAGAWMADNAWRYGFVMSYPTGSFERTCYDYEPWHYRYVGRDLAAQIAGSGRTPREVLWELQ